MTGWFDSFYQKETARVAVTSSRISPKKLAEKCATPMKNKAFIGIKTDTQLEGREAFDNGEVVSEEGSANSIMQYNNSLASDKGYKLPNLETRILYVRDSY